jgi:uncharacterized protein YndB with AHSA1/START domain
MTTATKPQARTASPDFVISREFGAPRELVWKAFAEAESMKQWWGPKDFKVIAARMDFRVGGTFHYGMTAPSGAPIWGLFRYREIVPRERMTCVDSFSDETGGIVRHPGHMHWPLEMLTTFTFEEMPGGKTRFTIRWQALNATAEEQRAFDANHDSMRMGWTGTLDRLAQYLAKA